MTDRAPQWQVLLHTPTEGRGAAVFQDPRFALHVAFLERMSSRGLLVAAGPLGDEPGAGMTVLRNVDAAEAERLAEHDDESVSRGLFHVRIRPWTVLLDGTTGASSEGPGAGG